MLGNERDGGEQGLRSEKNDSVHSRQVVVARWEISQAVTQMYTACLSQAFQPQRPRVSPVRMILGGVRPLGGRDDRLSIELKDVVDKCKWRSVSGREIANH
ncbi:hypothetical protein ZX61_06515 [Vibrio sp. VPAP30]|nr:hypothetical protein ZX61_06515 [Vibrio sp. VPAP30]